MTVKISDASYAWSEFQPVFEIRYFIYLKEDPHAMPERVFAAVANIIPWSEDDPHYQAWIKDCWSGNCLTTKMSDGSTSLWEKGARSHRDGIDVYISCKLHPFWNSFPERSAEDWVRMVMLPTLREIEKKFSARGIIFSRDIWLRRKLEDQILI